MWNVPWSGFRGKHTKLHPLLASFFLAVYSHCSTDLLLHHFKFFLFNVQSYLFSLHCEILSNQKFIAADMMTYYRASQIWLFIEMSRSKQRCNGTSLKPLSDFSCARMCFGRYSMHPTDSNTVQTGRTYILGWASEQTLAASVCWTAAAQRRVGSGGQGNGNVFPPSFSVHFCFP